MDPDHSQHLTVHYHGPASQPPPERTSLLAYGKEALSFAVSEEGWHSVLPHLDHAIFRLRSNCYEYALHPPLLHSDAKEQTLRDWNDEVSEMEVFRTEQLEEFKSTILDLELSRAYVSSSAEVSAGLLTPPSTALGVLRKAGSKDRREPAEGNPVKRRRLDSSSLYKVIERPHLYTSPKNLAVSLSSLEPHTKFYKGSQPMAIPPYTLEDVWDLFEDQFARCTWVIPIRGTPPWPDCTAAAILQEYSEGPCESAQDSSAAVLTSSEIIWTRDALRSFWSFLLQLREVQSLGPISLSFHAAPVTHIDAKVTDGTSSITTGRRPSAPTLLDTDHIKVYHDARYAVHLRNVLRAWSHTYNQPVTGPGNNKASTQSELAAASASAGSSSDKGSEAKVRLLKNVRLVLLDEQCQGILTC